MADITIIPASVGGGTTEITNGVLNLGHYTSAAVTTTSETVLATGTFTKERDDSNICAAVGGKIYCSTYTCYLKLRITELSQNFAQVATNNTNAANCIFGTTYLTNIPAGTYTIQMILGAQSGATAYAPAYNGRWGLIWEL